MVPRIRERRPLPPHEREGFEDEPTHGEIFEKLELIEELLRKIERRV